MRLISPLLCTLGALTLCACSGYGPPTLWDETGYSEERIRRDTYKVHYQGDKYLSEDKLKDFAWRRAAEICVDEGFTHFLVLTRLPEDGGQYEMTASDPSRDGSGQFRRTLGFAKTAPSYHIIVRFYRAPAPPNALDARETIRAIRAR